MKFSLGKTYKLLLAAFCGFIFSCADPTREYSPALKRTTPGIEYMPDMYRSPSYETNSGNPVFPDKKTSREPVPGTVPRMRLPDEYASLPDSVQYILTFPYRFPATQAGYDSAGKHLFNPLPASAAILDEGKILFEKYCTYCHGPGGKGDGIMVQKGKYPPPPSYSTGLSSRGGSLKDLTAGKIYHTIMYGVNLMGPHDVQLSPGERWKVVHYVQKLQMSADTTGQAR